MRLFTAPGAAALFGWLAVGLSACSRAPERAPTAAPAGERLAAIEMEIPVLKPVAAVVASRDLAQARARIAGTLTQLTVREGDRVREGQLIGVVSDDRLGLETAAYGAQVAEAEAEATRAHADLQRIRTLFDRGVYARARFDQALAAAGAADAQVRAARALRAASAERASQGRILAPASGRVLAADVPAGSVVEVGQTIAVITAGPLLLRLEAPEAEGRALRVGQSAQVSTEDLPGAGVAIIAQVYPAAAAGRITADLEAAGLTSDRVGQRVRVQLPIGRRDALVIPRRAVSTRYGLDFVRTIDRTGRISDAPVQLGAAVGEDRVEVLAGLAPGDIVAGPERGR